MIKKIATFLLPALLFGTVIAGCSSSTAPTEIEVKIVGAMSFDQKQIVVHKGQQVTLKLTNNDKTDHDFVVRELNVYVSVNPGESKTTTFTASQSGTFTFYCSTPGHKEGGMVGSFTVK